MKAVILAGGLGTRLRRLLPDTPKVLAPVGDKAFIEYILCQLQKSEIKDVILALGYKAKIIKEYLQPKKYPNLSIMFSEEQYPLGTGGAIKLAARFIEDDSFLVLNGDSFLAINLNDLVQYHISKKSFLTIALTEVSNAKRFGSVEININGKLVGFKEKVDSNSVIINAGIYVINKNFLEVFPDGPSSLERDIIPKFLGSNIYGKLYKTFFIDIGTPESYCQILTDYKTLNNLLK